MSDTKIRSLVKAISWRAIGTLDTFLISWLVTGHITLAGTIATIEIFTKIMIYWTHERIWNIIPWGKR